MRLTGLFTTSIRPMDRVIHRDKQIIGPAQVTGHIAPCWPIIAGGKRPERMGDYIAQIGSRDFMVIAASAVDDHPGGLAAGAQAFRAALERLR